MLDDATHPLSLVVREVELSRERFEPPEIASLAAIVSQKGTQRAL
jgi:hypothetical protein